MKRSTMLKELKGIMRAYHNDFAEYAEYAEGTLSMGKLLEKVASIVLTHIESKGMLPPLSDDAMSKVTFDVMEAILDQIPNDFKWDEE